MNTPNLNITNTIIEQLIQEFQKTREHILIESIQALLEKKLRAVNFEIFQIIGKYNIKNIHDFESLYQEGLIEEEGTFSDFQKLDHLEFRKDFIEGLLKKLQ